jgi:anti-sigma factor RsiW
MIAQKEKEGSTPPPVTCRQFIVDLLVQFLEGTTEPSLTLTIEEHIGQCPPCITFIETYKTTRQAVHLLRYEEIPVELTERLSELVRREAGRRRE